MERLKTYGLGTLGVLFLSIVLSGTGMTQAVASGAAAAVQKVTITNKSIQVSGSVDAAPSGPTQPVTFSATVTASKTTGEDTQVAYTVPAGKRLVIEFVSVTYQQQFSDEFAHTALSVGSGPKFFIPLTNVTGRGSGYDFLDVGAQTVRVYANAGDTIAARLQHETLIEPGSASFSFSGFLTNA